MSAVMSRLSGDSADKTESIAAYDGIQPLVKLLSSDGTELGHTLRWHQDRSEHTLITRYWWSSLDAFNSESEVRGGEGREGDEGPKRGPHTSLPCLPQQ